MNDRASTHRLFFVHETALDRARDGFTDEDTIDDDVHARGVYLVARMGDFPVTPWFMFAVALEVTDPSVIRPFELVWENAQTHEERIFGYIVPLAIVNECRRSLVLIDPALVIPRTDSAPRESPSRNDRK